MQKDLLHLGQWQGFFCYGPEYGELIGGKEAEFRMFIESLEHGQFRGKVIDWEGFGVDGEVSDLEGFIDDDVISFSKHYRHWMAMESDGLVSHNEAQEGHSVHYEGHFDAASAHFIVVWEIFLEDSNGVVLGEAPRWSGTWRMALQ